MVRGAVVVLVAASLAAGLVVAPRRPSRRSGARAATDDDADDELDFEAAFKARVADEGGELGVRTKATLASAGREAGSLVSSARDATADGTRRVAKALDLEMPAKSRESANTAVEEADLLTKQGWALTVGVLGLTVALAAYTQSQIDPGMY